MDTSTHPPLAETFAHRLLGLVGQFPGEIGRLRASRIVHGSTVPYVDGQMEAALQEYAVRDHVWKLEEVTRLTDALLSGGLLAQTSGPRPRLVLTRAGHRSLDAIEFGKVPA